MNTMLVPPSYTDYSTYFCDALKYLSDYSWLYNFPITKILVNNVLSKIPDDWLETLLQLTNEELNQLPLGLVKDDWPLSLLEFCHRSQALRLHIESPIGDQMEPKELPDKLRRGLTSKKQHEICRLGALIHHVCHKQEITRVLDIGAGLGYLGQMLHYYYGYKVLGLESRQDRVNAATLRQRGMCQSVGAVTYVPCNISIYSVDTIRQEMQQRLSLETSLCTCGVHKTKTQERAELNHSLTSVFNQNHSKPISQYSSKLGCKCKANTNIEGKTSNKDSYDLKTSILRDNTLDSSFEHDRKPLDDVRQTLPTCLVGLHVCGDLAVDAIKLFVEIPELRSLVLVPCCYHRIGLSCTSKQTHIGCSTKTIRVNSSFGKSREMVDGIKRHVRKNELGISETVSVPNFQTNTNLIKSESETFKEENITGDMQGDESFHQELCPAFSSDGNCIHREAVEKDDEEGELQETFHNFPLSSSLKQLVTQVESDYLRRPLLRLASQETATRWQHLTEKEHEEHSLHVMARAVLEVFAHEDNVFLRKKHRRGVRKTQLSNFKDFIQDALERYEFINKTTRGSPEQLRNTVDITDVRRKVAELWESHRKMCRVAEILTALQMVLQPVIEHLIISDRAADLEDKVFGLSCSLLRVMTEEISPRCLAMDMTPARAELGTTARLLRVPSSIPRKFYYRFEINYSKDEQLFEAQFWFPEYDGSSLLVSVRAKPPLSTVKPQMHLTASRSVTLSKLSTTACSISSFLFYILKLISLFEIQTWRLLCVALPGIYGAILTQGNDPELTIVEGSPYPFASV
uniref:Methyltransferase domain-containing protein n=1 Tax=Timema tahoe TaxID=61484 RepID=A0A7R9NYS1_9NEOP|nr:unnamed protein product [Timema tahoe]